MRPVQREFHRDLTGRDIIDKARKHGISTYVACRFYWKVTTRRNAAAAVVAHTPDATQALWEIVQLLHEHDPRRLHTRYSSRKELYFDGLNSRFTVVHAARGAARARTINYLHISELAWWKTDVRTTLSGMLAAVPQQGSEVIIESTANGEGNEYHRRWLDACNRRSEYQAHFFPWTEHAEYRRPWEGGDLTDAERQLVSRGLTREQLAFRRAMLAEHGLDTFRQEYPLTWQESFLASGRPVFDREALLELEQQHSRPPVREEREGESYLRIWSPPRRGRKYVAGADTSEGVTGGDAQDLRVLDFETLEEVAALHGRWPIHIFARKLSALCLPYRAVTAIERNNHGHAVLEHLLRGDDRVRLPRELVYRHRDYDRRTRQVTLKPGWPTDQKTKPIALADLEEALRKRHLIARDPLFYAEARMFAYQENGDAAAPEGEHDDSVMAMAIALQARKRMIGEVGLTSDRLRTGV